MFLSRFIHPKPSSHFRKIRFPQPRRWRYSTSTSTSATPGSENKSTALRAQKASAVESFVKKYKESHSGRFPSVTLVRNKVGGSWYTLRDIVCNLKETMMENPQVRVNLPSSAFAASYCNSPNKGEVGAYESTVMNTLCSKSNFSSAIAISGKTLSEETKDVATISGATNCNDSSSNEPHQAEYSVEPSTLVPSLDSHVTDIKLSQVSSSSITWECSSTKMLDSTGFGFTALAEPTCMVPMLESGESSLSTEKAPTFRDNASHLLDSKKLVDTKNDLFQLEELSELIRDVSTDQKKKHQTTRAVHVVAAEKLGSTESASHAESNSIALDSKRNSGSEIGENSGLSSQNLKGKGLAELLTKYLDDMPEVNSKQSAKAIGGSLSIFKTDCSLNSAQLPIDQFVPIESSKTLQEPSANVINSTGYNIPQSYVQVESSEGADSLRKTKDHPEARHKIMPKLKSDILKPSILDDSPSSSQKEVVGKDFEISTLINRLKEFLPTEQSNFVPHGNTNFTSRDQISKDRMGEVQSDGKLLQYDTKKRQTVLKGQLVVEKREKELGLEIFSKVSQANSMTMNEVSGDVAAVSAFDNIKSTSSAKGPLSMSDNDFNMAPIASSIEPLSNTSDNDFHMASTASFVESLLNRKTALLRFLPEQTTESDIAAAFKNHDDITRIEFSSVKKCKLKTAHVYFKTRNKLQDALKRDCLYVGNKKAMITIEDASSLDSCKLPDRIRIPNLIGDPGAPLLLLKNPTKTVMIKDLTDEVSSHHIREALLAFCKSNISGFFLGSSPSVAYVEFETEEGKDRALAEHLIFVQGKPLPIFRVDAPRTTVIRISGQITENGAKPLVNLCNSFGMVKAFFIRDPHVVDVHYDISEWANMLKILNRLNGMLLDGRKLHAQAAPVFPPNVILALWNQSEERRRLKGFMQKLMQKLQQTDVDITCLIELGARYYSNC